MLGCINADSPLSFFRFLSFFYYPSVFLSSLFRVSDDIDMLYLCFSCAFTFHLLREARIRISDR